MQGRIAALTLFFWLCFVSNFCATMPPSWVGICMPRRLHFVSPVCTAAMALASASAHAPQSRYGVFMLTRDSCFQLHVYLRHFRHLQHVGLHVRQDCMARFSVRHST
jgi:heme/copper-type cytochrome/quinol oxidase subunit 1